jgi:hypothetical protein
MAPEQITGHPAIASDQYSIGIILYEALTGTRPFAAADHHTLLLQHVTTTPLSPGMLAPELPPRVDAVVMRALAKKPADRFPTLEALANSFERAVTSASTAYGIAPNLSRVTAPIAASAASQDTPDAQAAFPTAADRRGDLPTAAHPRTHAAAQDPLNTPAASARRPLRQQSRRLIALCAGLAAMLLVISVASAMSHRGGNAANNIAQITAMPAQAPALTPTPTEGTNPNPYVQALRTAESHTLLFQDALRNNSEHWKLGHGVHFADNGLHLPSPSLGGDKENPSQNASAQQTNLALTSSCDVEVDIAINHPGIVYGFGFLYADHLGHLLTLSSSGNYTVSLFTSEHQDETKQLLSGANARLSLKSGQIAHLAILIQGNQIALFLNQQFITSLLLTSDSFTSAHLFELLNLSEGQSDGEVIFEHLSIYPV